MQLRAEKARFLYEKDVEAAVPLRRQTCSPVGSRLAGAAAPSLEYQVIVGVTGAAQNLALPDA